MRASKSYKDFFHKTQEEEGEKYIKRLSSEGTLSE
jgi:hypothetical protein